MVVPGEATPFITNKVEPKGGDVTPISKLSSIITPNHTGLKPRVLIMGTNIGRVIIIIAIKSINIPINSTTTCIAMTIRIGARGSPTASSSRPRPAPEKANIWL